MLCFQWCLVGTGHRICCPRVFAMRQRRSLHPRNRDQPSRATLARGLRPRPRAGGTRTSAPTGFARRTFSSAVQPHPALRPQWTPSVDKRSHTASDCCSSRRQSAGNRVGGPRRTCQAVLRRRRRRQRLCFTSSADHGRHELDALGPRVRPGVTRGKRTVHTPRAHVVGVGAAAVVASVVRG